jgi:hypothetical protein
MRVLAHCQCGFFPHPSGIACPAALATRDCQGYLSPALDVRERRIFQRADSALHVGGLHTSTRILRHSARPSGLATANNFRQPSSRTSSSACAFRRLRALPRLRTGEREFAVPRCAVRPAIAGDLHEEVPERIVESLDMRAALPRRGIVRLSPVARPCGSGASSRLYDAVSRSPSGVARTGRTGLPPTNKVVSRPVVAVRD